MKKIECKVYLLRERELHNIKHILRHLIRILDRLAHKAQKYGYNLKQLMAESEWKENVMTSNQKISSNHTGQWTPNCIMPLLPCYKIIIWTLIKSTK